MSVLSHVFEKAGLATVGISLVRGQAETVKPPRILNVNFPDRAPDEVAGIMMTRQGFRDERIIRTEAREDLRGNAYYWIGYRGKLSNPDEGTDLRAIYDGYVSVSPLQVDLTHDAFLTEMRETFQS